MGTIANPFEGLIQGVLQGHAIAEHLRNQAMQEELYQRAKQNEDRQNQLKDIQAQISFQTMGRPVQEGSNAVVQQFDAGTPSSIPGMPDISQPIHYARPVDKSRLLSYKTSDGRTIQSEAYTPEEVQQQHFSDLAAQGLVNAQTAGQADIVKRQMDRQYYESELNRRGVPAPQPFIDSGFAQAGQKFLPEELRAMAPEVQKAMTPELKDVAPGASVLSIPRPSAFGTAAPMVNSQQQGDLSQTGLPSPVMPGISTPGRASIVPGLTVQPQDNPIAAAAAPAQQARQAFVDSARATRPQILFSSAPKQTPEEDYADAFARTLTNPAGQPLKSRTEMSKPQWDTALGQYKTANADPEARASLISARQSAEASRALSDTMRQIQLDQAPTKEQAAQIADDLVHHNLSPDQISQIRGRGNGGLGLMVYSAAKKLDPTFNWEQASSEYQLSKSPAFQQTVRYMDSVQESIPQVIDRAKRLNNFGVKGIAQLINAGKNQVNDIDLKKFHTDSLLVADEIAKILSGGGTGGATSDAKLKQAGDILGQSDSPAAIAAALGEVQQLIGFRRKALTKGTYLENADARAMPAALPKGGGKAADATIIQQFLDANGGNKTLARKALTDNGWTIPQVK